MADYIIRNVDDALWRKVKARAESEGRSIRWVIVEILKRYVSEGMTGPTDAKLR